MASEDAPDIEVLLAQLVSRSAWHRQANCRGANPDPFFPERGSHRSIEALAYCEDCSVRSECLASALAVASTTGVWGGTTGRGCQGPAAQRGVTMPQPSLQPTPDNGAPQWA